MKLSNHFNEVRQNFINAVQNNETQEVQNELYSEMLNCMFDECKTIAKTEVEGLIAQNPAEAKMSARERKFFNDIKKDAPAGIVEHLPEETVDRIFENLTREHPLLEHIGLRNAGIRLKFYAAETTGKAVWGDLFGDIKGQLEETFSVEHAIQNKLTAFVVLPKDLTKFGPAWIQSFVMTQIQEAFATALELAFLTGNGEHQPVGLNRKLTGTTTGDVTTYPEKESNGNLTLSDSDTVVEELTQVFKYHSTDAKDKPVLVDGKVVMVVNPTELWDVKKQYTSLNAQGVYVTSMPFNLIVIDSVAQPKGKVTTFVKGRYDAFIGGNLDLSRYTETLALEDRDIFIAKQFAYGKARDEKAAAVWTLRLPAKKGKAGTA